MFTMTRLALFFIVAATLPLFAAGEALAGGGLLPPPPGLVFSPSREITATIVLDPNGPVGAPATPTGTFGTITLNGKKASATTVFWVQPSSTLGDLVFGCNLLLTNARFVNYSTGEVGLQVGSPGATNWLDQNTSTSLFAQIGVALVDQSNQVVLIPGITRVVTQRCEPFPPSYPDLSGNSGSTPETTWYPGFLIMDVEIGFWAAPGVKTPH